jgi:hypothetical protein
VRTRKPVLDSRVADPDPHKFELLDPDPGVKTAVKF